jgi:hypothetical protein
VSADNWAQCPRCTAAGLKALEARNAAVHAGYGTVPVDEFDEARRQHAAAVAKFEQRQPTFREDYEIDGAEDGVITVRYRGGCRECGLGLSFTDERPIPGLEASE